MISVEEALDHLFALATPVGREVVPLLRAAGRVLSRTATAVRDQPPFPASAMDGYAVAGAAPPGARFRVVGTSAAGHRFTGGIGVGDAVRIFTGAPLPEGATRVVIQEDVVREGETITLCDSLDEAVHVRPQGQDFRAGATLTAPRLLRPVDLALLAAMNVASVEVFRRPIVAVLATGDELVEPGDTPHDDQIVASNSLALAAMVEEAGGAARLLPIARDTSASLEAAFDLAAGADLVVTIGGASVGDHDLVGAVAEHLGMARAFYRIAMRPGKPLMAGRLRGVPLLGLPGNPVSSIVCGHVFLLPMLRAMMGLGAHPAPTRAARLGVATGPAGPRAHYMRARIDPTGDGDRIVPLDRQDSALISVLAAADALLIRAKDDPAREAGFEVTYIPV